MSDAPEKVVLAIPEDDDLDNWENCGGQMEAEDENVLVPDEVSEKIDILLEKFMKEIDECAKVLEDFSKAQKELHEKIIPRLEYLETLKEMSEREQEELENEEVSELFDDEEKKAAEEEA